MGLKELMYQGGQIPANTSPNRVRQLRAHLMDLLIKEIGTEYRWLAACTVAVEAGRWGGERRRIRRLKLQTMIGQCSDFLGEPSPTGNMPKGWEMSGLYYGYGAISKFSRESGADVERVIMLGIIDSRDHH